MPHIEGKPKPAAINQLTNQQQLTGSNPDKYFVQLKLLKQCHVECLQQWKLQWHWQWQWVALSHWNALYYDAFEMKLNRLMRTNVASTYLYFQQPTIPNRHAIMTPARFLSSCSICCLCISNNDNDIAVHWSTAHSQNSYTHMRTYVCTHVLVAVHVHMCHTDEGYPCVTSCRRFILPLHS